MSDERSSKIRLQPTELEVPPDEPTLKDKLHRKDLIEDLTTMLGNLDGPGVVAIDAGWGTGKTTFLRMWAQHLRNEKFPVVEFNAWETDFALDPFIALSTELTKTLTDVPGIAGRTPLARLRQATSDVANVAALPTARLLSAAIPLIGRQLAQELSHSSTPPFETAVVEYAERQQAHQQFRQRLGEVASEVADGADGRPLVVMIDELDRCRPTYAIELLETAKHLFSVDHIVFVLCLDREQLGHSVKAVYGSEFAAEGYLRRFFDLDLGLPSPDREQFVNAAIASSGLYRHLRGRSEYQRSNWYSDPEAVVGVLSLPILSLRDALQVLHRLSMIVSSIPDNHYVFAEALTVLLTLRTVDVELYRRMQVGTVTDEEVVATLLSGRAQSREYIDKVRLAVEATVAGRICIATRDNERIPDKAKLPMTQRYHSTIDDSTASNQGSSEAKEHANLVLLTMSKLFDPDSGRGPYELGEIRDRGANIFREIDRRVELFPAERRE